jgi:hypothetical protein
VKTGRQLQGKQGQSLVEMALTLPFLLLMFVGLIEVGYVLRNYLVVVNANREGTRFAARGRWFDEPEEWEFIVDRVVAAAGTDLRGNPFFRTQDADGLPPNVKIAIHYVEVPSQYNEELGELEEQEPEIFSAPPWGMNCPDCEPLGLDELIVIANKARQENEEFNRKYFVEDELLDLPSEDNFVIIETWYDHEQLLELPIFTAFLPDKIPLYVSTQMRVTLSRELFGGGKP